VSNAEEEFVTIAHAARLLNVSERQAHRYVRLLSDTDKQKADKSPTLVRLSALRASRGMSDTLDEVSDNAPQMSDIVSDTVSLAADTNAGEAEVLRAQLVEVRAQLAATQEREKRLWETLQREQETARAALRELNEERQRGMIMLAATAAGKIGAQEATGDTDSPPETPAAVSVPDAPETKRGLFARLFGR